MKLTERKIETLATEHGRKDRLVFDDAQRGLAVRVTASGGRTYLCQYTLHGQKWRVPLGSCSAVSLADARDAAAAIMGDIAKGRNVLFGCQPVKRGNLRDLVLGNSLVKQRKNGFGKKGCAMLRQFQNRSSVENRAIFHQFMETSQGLRALGIIYFDNDDPVPREISALANDFASKPFDNWPHRVPLFTRDRHDSDKAW